jgi:hypothetical protein
MQVDSCAAGGQLNASSCTLGGNSAVFGAALSVRAGRVLLTECNVTGNRATQAGGGVAVFAGTCTLLSSLVNDNWARTGGAAAVSGVTGAAEAALEARSSRLVLNRASDGGGGLSIQIGTVTLVGGDVASNQAGVEGGGIQVTTGTPPPPPQHTHTHLLSLLPTTTTVTTRPPTLLQARRT